MRTLLFCGLLIGSCVADGGNLLKNGSFELGSPGGVPENWHFAASGAAQAEIAVTDESATDGKQALRFASTSARQPNVYGMVVQEAPLRAIFAKSAPTPFLPASYLWRHPDYHLIYTTDKISLG